MSIPSYTLKEFSKEKSLANALRYLGESDNGATIVACSIALFKGIFRPLFTMMDKQSDPETKKYAAFREGLTEVAALPIYASIPFLIGKAMDKFYNGAEAKKVKQNAKFLGICVATLIIPAVCNIIQPPIMNAYKKHEAAKKNKLGLDVTSESNMQPPLVVNNQVNLTSNPLPKTLPVSNSGMRVGN